MSVTVYESECCSDQYRIREQYQKWATYMAQANYLTTAYWKCIGPHFNFIHDESNPLGSCMVVGKVSSHGSFLAPYGNFDIQSDDGEMRRAKYQFTLVRPDDSSIFQPDFDACIATTGSIVEHFRSIETASPFVTDGPEGPSFNFTHDVFKCVVVPIQTDAVARFLGFTGEHLIIAKSLSPQYEPRRLPVYRECVSHTGHAHVISTTDVPNMMKRSLVSVRFNITYSDADGLTSHINAITVIKS